MPTPSSDLAAPSAPPDIDRQLPAGNEVFLDHLAHFVHDTEAARSAFARCGFAPTPVSIQVSPNPAGGTSPTGTGNVTAMFSRGYIEVLFKTSDTPLSREFDAALARHAGLHLAAFAVADAEAAHRRLAADGFAVRPLVHMRARSRQIQPRHRGLHHRSRRTRRDAGRPHPDADPSHRRGGVAEAMAHTPEQRHRLDRRRHRCRRCRRGRAALCAFHRRRDHADARRRIAAPRPRRRLSRQP